MLKYVVILVGHFGINTSFATELQEEHRLEYTTQEQADQQEVNSVSTPVSNEDHTLEVRTMQCRF